MNEGNIIDADFEVLTDKALTLVDAELCDVCLLRQAVVEYDQGAVAVDTAMELFDRGYSLRDVDMIHRVVVSNH